MDLLQGPPVDRPAQLRDADRHRAHAAARRHVDLPGAAVRTFARQVAPLLRQHALGGRSPERRRLRLPHRIDPATQHVRRRTDRVRRPQLQGAAAARSRDDLARDARRDRPLRRCRRQGLLRRLDPLESPRSGGSRRRRQGGATPDGRPDEAVPRPDPPRRGAAQGTPHRLVQGVAAEIRTDTRRPHRQSRRRSSIRTTTRRAISTSSSSPITALRKLIRSTPNSISTCADGACGCGIR